MNNTDNITTMLIVILAILVLIVAILIFVYIMIRVKEKREIRENTEKNKKITENKDVSKGNRDYTKESIFDFMEFEKIEDNMIIQKKDKFLMVIECQGINYDLMSEIEKNSVEQGFLEFLNTLKFPVQFYIQTRTVDLEQSIKRYKDKLKVIENKYNDLRLQYTQMQKNGDQNVKILQKTNYELVKQKNLYEYTQDIIKNIERNNLNANVLNKRYYIILPYYRENMEAGAYSKEEIQSMVFSELYTRARAVINTLFSCQVQGKILNSMELIELLYQSYNRDESTVFKAQEALSSGFEELYSTAIDVLEKKMQALDKEAERRALELANEIVEETRNEREYRKKKENLNKLVMQLAKGMIEHDRAIIGEDLAEEAIGKIEAKEENKQDKEGGTENEIRQEKVQKRRGRPRNISA